MAIPHPSQLLTPRQRLILRSSLAIAVLSLTYLALIYAGALPSALRPKAQCPPLRTQPARGCPACPAAAAPGQPAAAVVAVQAEQPALDGSRYSICEAEGGDSILRILQLTAEGAPALGVHCGSSVHLLAFDSNEPRRIARFAGRGSDRGLSEHAGALSVLDLSGDGASDLIVGTNLRDAQGIPHGGTLYQVLRLPNGGFGEARALAPLAVGGACPIDLHTPGADDLAVLRLEEARVGRSNEVFLLRGGAAPVKALSLPAGPGMNQLAAADLDLDGNVDLVLAGTGRTADVVYLDAKAQPLRRMALDPGPVQAVLVVDLDGDGHDDLVIASDESRVILARSGSTAIAHPLALPQGFRVLRAVDWNGDGKIDLIGQLQQSLLAMLQTSSLTFERSELASWPDQELRVLGAMWSSRTGGTVPAALVLIASPVQARGQIELLISRQVPWVMGKLRAVPIPEAPLSLQLALP
ncbi:MAG TPA: VCBS repeat-containing protein [Polyangiales bacterium]|nr:VCBS repeat-containing protein [Polyangiales bacterium]